MFWDSGHSPLRSDEAMIGPSVPSRARRALTELPDEGTRRRDCGVVQLLSTGSRYELHSGTTQSALARGGALLLAHEAGHAGDHEQEEHSRRRDQDEPVDVGERLPDANPGSDEARAGEQASRNGVRRVRDSSAGSSSVRIDGWSAAAPQSR